MTRLSLMIAVLSVVAAALPAHGRTHGPSAPVDSAAVRSLQAVEQRAEAGDNAARFRLARALETGYGNVLARDSVRARRLLEQSAHGGYAPALNYLGFILYNEQRPDSAVSLFMAAADRGDLTAYTNLGWLLLNGRGAVRDPAKALYWLRKGSAKGSAPAAAMLGDMHRTGVGVPADTAAARDCYDRALSLYAEHEYRDSRAIADITGALNSLYTSRDSLPADSLLSLADRYMELQAPGVAMRFYAVAAERGNARAQSLLGKGYAMALGLPYSHAESLRWYLAAARGGDQEARRILAELLEITPDALRDLPPELAPGLREEESTPQYWQNLSAEP